jgi:cellulose synthase/poly-beta-1,6-N-acetylglucosamine synthase-like glycosyltransferase
MIFSLVGFFSILLPAQVTHKPDMEAFFLVVIGLYAGLVLALGFGWAQATERGPAREVTGHRLLSVVVPFRNEEPNIAALAADLCAQLYPHAAFELIFVNDHSTDRSVEVLAQVIRNQTNARLVNLAGAEGKKAALHEGIGLAHGEVIVTTDADCRLDAEWLACINRAFALPGTQAAIGAVKLVDGGRLWHRLQAVEQWSLVAVAAGSAGWGKPVLCSGANFAFNRAAFYEVGGYADNWHIASGDDEFLMRKIVQAHPHSMRFMTDAASVVTTQAQPSLRSFVQQRLRWAGKWRHNTSVPAKVLAVLVLGVQLVLLSVMVATLAGWLPATLGLAMLGARFFVEALLLLPVARFVQQRWRWSYFLMLQFLYPVYVVAIGFASQWVTAVWKDRRVNTTV